VFSLKSGESRAILLEILGKSEMPEGHDKPAIVTRMNTTQQVTERISKSGEIPPDYTLEASCYTEESDTVTHHLKVVGMGPVFPDRACRHARAKPQVTSWFAGQIWRLNGAPFISVARGSMAFNR
jgi:hypothetical protein